MTDLNLYPIDPKEVYTFLLSHAFDAVVGTSCNDGDCPLARFLHAQYEGAVFMVNMTEYQRLLDEVDCCGATDDVTFPLPLWAQDFVWEVDHSADFVEGVPVVAREALGVLEAVCSRHSLWLREVLRHD